MGGRIIYVEAIVTLVGFTHKDYFISHSARLYRRNKCRKVDATFLYKIVEIAIKQHIVLRLMRNKIVN